MYAITYIYTNGSRRCINAVPVPLDHLYMHMIPKILIARPVRCLHPPPALPLTALHALDAVVAQLLRAVGRGDAPPAGERDNERGHVVVAAHVLREGEDAFRGVLWAGRTTREVGNLVVGHDRGDAVGEERDVRPFPSCDR